MWANAPLATDWDSDADSDAARDADTAAAAVSPRAEGKGCVIWSRAAEFLISFKLASVAQSGGQKMQKKLKGQAIEWPLFIGQWPLELNSNFNAILHIQAHYSRLPTYFPASQKPHSRF